jgi:hypothetical protein
MTLCPDKAGQPYRAVAVMLSLPFSTEIRKNCSFRTSKTNELLSRIDDDHLRQGKNPLGVR